MAHDNATATRTLIDAWSDLFEQMETLKRLNTWREMWLQLCLRAGPTDRPAFETAVEACYRAAGEPWHGNVVWLSSPVGNVGLPPDEEAPTHGNPRHRKLDLFTPALRQALPQMELAMEPGDVLDLCLEDFAIRANNAVNATLIDVIEEAAIPEWASPYGREMALWLLSHPARLNTLHGTHRAAINHVPPSPGLERVSMRNAASLASLSFIRDGLGIAIPGSAGECLQAFEAASKEVQWWYPTSDCVLACERPTAIHIESTEPAGRSFLSLRSGRRLHADHGPAVAWPDGWAIYAIHGVVIPHQQRHIVEQPDTITVAEIEAEHNSEIRRIMIERYGAARFLTDSGASVVHELPADHPSAGLRGARLLRKDMPRGEPVVCVDLLNSTPEPDGSVKRYMLRVDPNAYGGETARNAHAAAASTWRHADGRLVYADWRDYRPWAES